MTSINYPCVILEKPLGHITVSSLSFFAICRSQYDIDRLKSHFKEPVLCHYYSVVNESLRIEKLINSK